MPGAKYIRFYDGPDHRELQSLRGKEVSFTGAVMQGLTREVVDYDVETRVRIKESFLFSATHGHMNYQINAVAMGDKLFRKGEKIVFEYDSVAQQSEEIYLG